MNCPADVLAHQSLTHGVLRSIGFGFSAGGMLFPYYIGVLDALSELDIITGEPAALPSWLICESQRLTSGLCAQTRPLWEAHQLAPC